MYSTIGNVALTDIIDEKHVIMYKIMKILSLDYFHDFVQYPKQRFFVFLQPRDVLRMFLNCGHFSASRSCKKVLIIRESV